MHAITLMKVFRRYVLMFILWKAG